MNMNLNDAELKTIMVKAILDHLTPEKREELISSGITSVLSSKASDRYDAPTIFESAFREAVKSVARDIAAEELKKPEMHAKLRELIVSGVEKAIGLTDADDWNSIQSKIADAVVRGMTGERY